MTPAEIASAYRYSVTFEVDGQQHTRVVDANGPAQAVARMAQDFEDVRILSVVDVTDEQSKSRDLMIQERIHAFIDADPVTLCPTVDEVADMSEEQFQRALSGSHERKKKRDEENAARVATAEKEAAEAAEREDKLREALRPDREKLMAVADELDAITWPTLSDDALEVGEQVGQLLEDCSVAIRGAANKLVRISEVA